MASQSGPSHVPSFTMEVRILLPQMLIAPQAAPARSSSASPEDSLASFFRSLPIPSISAISGTTASSTAVPVSATASATADAASVVAKPATDLVAEGTGSTKKEAKNAAARAALQLLAERYGLTYEAVRELDTRLPKPLPPPPAAFRTSGVIITEVTDEPPAPAATSSGTTTASATAPAASELSGEPSRPVVGPPAGGSSGILSRFAQLESGTRCVALM